MILQPKELERLFQKIKFKSSCWIWTGATKTGRKNRKNNKRYGVLTIRNKHMQAHVLTYKCFKGEIPAGLEIDHLCKNTLCVNPEHLEAVTHSENMKRSNSHWKIVQINKSKKHCPQGHKYNKENTYIHEGQRHCRICLRNRSRVYSEKKRRESGMKTWAERYPQQALKSAGEI